MQWMEDVRENHSSESNIDRVPHRACGHTREGSIHSPEAVRYVCRPKCARRAWIGEELGRVGGVRQGVLGAVA